MFDTFLVPEKTLVNANGDGNPIDISSAKNRKFLLLLRVSEAVEQESLDLSILGSADGQTWNAKAIAAFSQMYYVGEQPNLLELDTRSETKFVRAHWEVNRWGRGSETPMFQFDVRLTEVVPEMLG